MRASMRKLGALALFGGALLIACSRSGEAPGSDPATPGGAHEESRLASGSTSNVRSAGEVKHAGTRRVELYDGVGLTLAYREVVLTDGQGSFSLRSTGALTPVTSAWLPIQTTLEGFLFRYRDFDVRDERLFAQNYRVRSVGTMSTVAGRSCEDFEATRVIGESKRFAFSLDKATGLVLRYDEYDANDRLLAHVEYETFDPQPDLSGAVWFPGLTNEIEIDLQKTMQPTFSEFREPTLLPEGYERIESFSLRSEGVDWIKVTYSDGVDTLFYLYGAPQTPDGGSTGLGSGLQGSFTAHGPDGPESMYVYRIGAAGAAHATLDDATYIVVGKVSEDELVETLQSAAR